LHAAHALARAAHAAAAAQAPREQVEGSIREAIAMWTAVVEHEPRAMEGHGAAIGLASLLGDADALSEVLGRAQRAETSPWPATSLALRRARLIGTLEPRRVAELLRASGPGEGSIDDPRRTLVLALAAARASELGDAVSALDERATQLEAAKHEGEHVEAATLRVRAAQIALDAGDVARAMSLLVRAERALPNVCNDLIDAARARGGTLAAGPRPRTRAESFTRALFDADLAAARGERPAALELYQRALEVRPSEPLAATPLVRIATALRQPAPIRAVIQDQLRAAQALDDAMAQAEVYEQLARVELELANDPRAAQTALASALKAVPTRLDVMHQLERAHAVARRHGELLRLREQEIALVRGTGGGASGGAPDELSLVLDAAMLAARDRRPDDQVEKLYLHALELAPMHRVALFGRDGLLRRSAASEQLARLQHHIAEVFPEPRTKAAFLVRAGETFALCGQPAEAVARFARAVEAPPTYAPALDAWYRVALAG
jgi:tetratricopeptide (TPR) repeat protein